MRSYKYFDIIMAFFVTVLITSNIASSAKLVDCSLVDSESKVSRLSNQRLESLDSQP